MITEFSISTIQPWVITAGPDGNLWFAEVYGNNIGRITPAGVITEFPVPTGGTSFASFGITAGPDGNLWFMEEDGDQIGRITPAGVITLFPLPARSSGRIGITSGPDGNLWFTEGANVNKIGRITTAGAITEFPIPTRGSDPSFIALGPDGNLWFTELSGNNIGRITPLARSRSFRSLQGAAIRMGSPRGRTAICGSQGTRGT